MNYTLLLTVLFFANLSHGSETNEIIIYLPGNTNELTQTNEKNTKDNNNFIPHNLLDHLQKANNQDLIDTVLLNIAHRASTSDLYQSIKQVDAAAIKSSEEACSHLVQSAIQKHETTKLLTTQRIKELNKKIKELHEEAQAAQEDLDGQTQEYCKTLALLKSWHSDTVPSPLIKPVIIKERDPKVSKDAQGNILFDGLRAI